MAKYLGNPTAVRPGIPVDEPVLLEPGVMHREADYHGNAKFYTLPPEDPLRANKGDLGLSVIPNFDSRALSHDGVPFANLRRGR